MRFGALVVAVAALVGLVGCNNPRVVSTSGCEKFVEGAVVTSGAAVCINVEARENFTRAASSIVFTRDDGKTHENKALTYGPAMDEKFVVLVRFPISGELLGFSQGHVVSIGLKFSGENEIWTIGHFFVQS